MTEKSRLTLDLTPELHRKLKVAAARRGQSMRELCIRAIEHEVESQQKKPYLTAAEAPLLAELWDNEFDAIYDDVEL
jgi:plasmid stability protein